MRQQEFIGQYLIGYHGTDQSVVDRVLSGKAKHLEAGGLGHDWLGDGIYFWVDSPERAFAWANERSRFPGSSITAPAAIGAVIQPGRCFNLTDFGAAQQLKGAYDHLKSAIEAAKKPMPVNTVRDKYGLYRKRALDCLVIQTVHSLREEFGKPPYDSVLGVFEEGGEVFPGASIKERSHIQIAVRSLPCIIGYFHVPMPTVGPAT